LFVRESVKFYLRFPDASVKVCPPVREVWTPFPVWVLLFREGIREEQQCIPDILHCYTVSLVGSRIFLLLLVSRELKHR